MFVSGWEEDTSERLPFMGCYVGIFIFVCVHLGEVSSRGSYIGSLAVTKTSVHLREVSA